MKMRLFLSLLVIPLVLPGAIYSWGEDGHKILAEIAKRHLDKDTLAKVTEALDGATFDEASIWMDEVRKDSPYYHMVTWHYINLEKGEIFRNDTKEENVVNELRRVVKKLNNRHKYKKKDIARHLKILFHLLGDLHQPLHTGYGSDRGGNNVPVEINGNATNLHGTWDYEIIAMKKITADDCMRLENQMTPEEVDAVKRLNVVDWFKESRSHVSPAYEIGDGKLTDAYIEVSANVIRKQLYKGGIRLAAVLTRLFKEADKKKLKKPGESDVE